MSTKTIRLTDKQGNTLLPESGERGVGYTKFADGTLLYSGSVNITPAMATAKSDAVADKLHRFFVESVVVFPEQFQFAWTPEVIATVRQNTSGVFLISEITPSQSGFGAELWTSQTTWGVLTISFLAFGRWK